MKRKIVGLKLRKNIRPRKHVEYNVNAVLIGEDGTEYKTVIGSKLKRDVKSMVSIHEKAVEEGKLFIADKDGEALVVFE